MKLVELRCKNCGAVLKVDESKDNIVCPYCDAHFKLDDEVHHVQFDNSEQNGYEFEKGRMKAQQEEINKKIDERNEIIRKQQEQESKKKRRIYLILAWIFLFPFTATYFIAKSEKIDKNKKIIYVIILWIAFFIIALLAPSKEETNNENQNNNTVERQ